VPQPDRTPDIERPLKPDVPEPDAPKPADTGRRAGRFRRFVARQLRRGADKITARRAARTGR
jgi:hypothetical protein